MVFDTDAPDRFIPIDFASEITINPVKNAIIDVDENSTHDFEDISKRLSELFCSAIEIRFFKSIEIEEIYQILGSFETSTMRTINLSIKYNKNWTIENILILRSQNRRLNQIILHHSPFEKSEQQSTISILYTKQKITDQTHCGLIKPHYFMSNLSFFKESLQVNNCLDRKIGIDTKGNIKNCPSMEKSFGHISQIDFKNLINSNSFRKVWSITKDEIDICKECEFRYICMDCRAYKSEKNQYSKPTKCNYNPYTTQWEE
ncbi:grasp-with-spasm system SPASM domain peptide maturase [Bernardetia sp. OM2101]|uniref:grasp-with-spasm system SPASM domain peptide maturase n=1 Tax=Bernardetia sp. OM2101 TaxID=3344876 RepID=UPI0035CEBAA0